MRRRYCSQTGTQAKTHEKQTAGARNVQSGGKRCERERERDKKADRCHETRAARQATRQADELAKKEAPNCIKCRKDRIIASSMEALMHTSNHSRLSSENKPKKCRSVRRSGVSWAVD